MENNCERLTYVENSNPVWMMLQNSTLFCVTCHFHFKPFDGSDDWGQGFVEFKIWAMHNEQAAHILREFIIQTFGPETNPAILCCPTNKTWEGWHVGFLEDLKQVTISWDHIPF